MTAFLIDHTTGAVVLDVHGNPVPAPFGGLARWGDTYTPHSGWRCIEIFRDDDLTPNAPPTICHMCDMAAIKYIHRMVHPTFPESLLVGYCCAAHMSGDLLRLKELRSEADAIHAAVVKYRGEWSRRPNDFILRPRGFRLVVRPQGKMWSGWFVHRTTGDQWRTPLLPSFEEATRAAVAYMVKARRKIAAAAAAAKQRRHAAMFLDEHEEFWKEHEEFWEDNNVWDDPLYEMA